MNDVYDNIVVQKGSTIKKDEYDNAIKQNQSRRVRAIIRNIDNDELILVLYRKNSDHRTIKVMLPGGGVEFDETVYQALEREINEELGVSMTVDSTNCRYYSSERVFSKPRNQVSDSDVANKNCIELIFMQLTNFDHVPVNKEAYRGVLGFEWIKPDQLLTKVANSEGTLVLQTALEDVLKILYRDSLRKNTDMGEDEAEINDSRRYMNEHTLPQRRKKLSY